MLLLVKLGTHTHVEVFADVKGIVVQLARSVATDKQRLLPLGESAKSFLHCSLSLTQSLATEKEDLDAVDRKGILTVPSQAGRHIEPVKPLLIEPPLCPTLPFDIVVHIALSNEGTVM